LTAEGGIKSKGKKLFPEACMELQFSLTIYPTFLASLGSVGGFRNIRQLTKSAATVLDVKAVVVFKLETGSN
jgi:hypothetical protein